MSLTDFPLLCDAFRTQEDEYGNIEGPASMY